jgi:hypothetical protein
LFIVTFAYAYFTRVMKPKSCVLAYGNERA